MLKLKALLSAVAVIGVAMSAPEVLAEASPAAPAIDYNPEGYVDLAAGLAAAGTDGKGFADLGDQGTNAVDGSTENRHKATNGGAAGDPGKEQATDTPQLIPADYLSVPGCEKAGDPYCIEGRTMTGIRVRETVPQAPAAGAPAPTPAPPTRAEVEGWVARVLLQLRVPKPDIMIGPDPSTNEWNMAVVGYPLWLWTAEPTTRSATLNAFGYDFRLDASRKQVTFDMGDGSESFTCTTVTPYPGDAAPVGAMSPSCGYTYAKPSLPRGTYTIRATARWAVDWAAAGYSGTLTMRLTSTRDVRVGELQSIRVR